MGAKVVSVGCSLSTLAAAALSFLPGSILRPSAVWTNSTSADFVFLADFASLAAFALVLVAVAVFAPFNESGLDDAGASDTNVSVAFFAVDAAVDVTVSVAFFALDATVSAAFFAFDATSLAASLAESSGFGFV